jgi:hydrogenase maturation protease
LIWTKLLARRIMEMLVGSKSPGRKAVPDALPPILVAAYGNEMAADDSFGPRVAEAVSAMALGGVEVVSLAAQSGGLLSHLAGCRAVCVVDAAQCDGLPVGALIEMDLRDPKRPQLIHEGTLSTHGLSLAAEIELAERLGLCPEHVHLVAVIAGSFELGRPAGEEVLRQVPAAADRIAAWARSLMKPA